LREGQTEVPQQIFLWESNDGDNQMWYLEPWLILLKLKATSYCCPITITLL
jgi:hypothetical protein